MLITKLTLNNFRVFRGVHEVDLETQNRFYGEGKSQLKPIILFGGLNGTGKTSILTAVRLALFGRQALGSTLTNGEYIEALSELIHKGASSTTKPTDASIELEFTYSLNGKESLYKVIRAWKKGKKDHVLIEQDGKALEELSYEQCQGFLNELIPLGIADLFFFDGEKIADLAEDESGTVLKTAVKRLLGLDIITKLKNDLSIFLKKEGSNALSKTIREQINELEEQRVQHQSTGQKHESDADNILTQIKLTSKEIAALESKLSSRGGAWAKTREDEQKKINLLLKEKVELEKQIRIEMEGNLPFAFAPKAISKLTQLIETEQNTKQKQSFSKELKSFLDKLGVDNTPNLRNAIKEHVGDIENAEILLDVSDSQAANINYKVNTLAQTSFKQFNQARKRLQQVEFDIDNASSNVARAPEQASVEKLFAKVRELDKKKSKCINQYHDTLLAAKEEFREALDLAKQIQKLHDKNRDSSNKNQGVSNAQNAQLLLEKFSEQLTKARVKQLEIEFVKSYQKLARKEDLQLSASIDTNTFDVKLVDESGISINRKAMSAGEKQIYAISILEALGKTSGRKLPIIIDTPLGRLDSHHRDKLVENYFPHASHQVVILSTDTEIDKQYVDSIEDDITRTYEICFDGRTKSSTLKSGYFWKPEVKEAV